MLTTKQRVATTVATLARVALGALWVNEGVLKYHAGFGTADILLVVHSAGQNSRVPDFAKFFTSEVIGAAPHLFGIAVPLLEVCVGIVLILGVLTLPAALGSVALLCSYWLVDQLITQYPIMLALSAAVAVFSFTSSRFSITTLAARKSPRLPARARRWL